MTEIEKVEVARLRSLAANIIDAADRYYRVPNPDEETPKILEDIVFSAGIMYKILKDKK
jgi:hypothetical protein